MEFEIREVADEELDECLTVIHQSFGTVAREFGLTQNNCPTNGAFMKKERLIYQREKGNQQYGLFFDNKMVRFMELAQIDEEQYSMEKLGVLPEYRHNGFGRKLMDYAKEVVKAAGGTLIIIGIIEENVILKRWYSNYGFMHKGTRVFDQLPFTVGFMELQVVQKNGCNR